MAQYDIKLFGDKMICDDPVEAAIQELDILFNTEQTELIGDTSFGVNFEQFLWTLNPSEHTVNQYIKDKIIANTYYCNKLDISINTKIVEGTIRDIYEVTLTIKTNSGQEKIKNMIFK